MVTDGFKAWGNDFITASPPPLLLCLFIFYITLGSPVKMNSYSHKEILLPLSTLLTCLSDVASITSLIRTTTTWSHNVWVGREEPKKKNSIGSHYTSLYFILFLFTLVTFLQRCPKAVIYRLSSQLFFLSLERLQQNIFNSLSSAFQSRKLKNNIYIKKG